MYALYNNGLHLHFFYRKKESLLSKKDRILLLNNIPELTCSPSIR